MRWGGEEEGRAVGIGGEELFEVRVFSGPGFERGEGGVEVLEVLEQGVNGGDADRL